VEGALRVYVAGSSLQIERVKAAQRALEERGHVVSHDWSSLIEEHGANPLDASDKQITQWASDDLHGVYNADVVWLLMPSDGGFGAAVALGYALAHSKPVVISGAYARSIFTIFGTCYDRDDQALEGAFGYCDCENCDAARNEAHDARKGRN
jgi:nucleoside 2-deoxyribosyltransferase